MDGWIKPIGEISSPLSWNLLFRQLYQGQRVGTDGSRYLPIPPDIRPTNANVLLIGAENINAPPSWDLGCWLTSNLTITPDSTSLFDGLSEIGRYAVPLNKYRMIWIPGFTQKPYQLELRFPRWHSQLLVECWWLDEELTTDIQATLIQINAKLDTLTQP